MESLYPFQKEALKHLLSPQIKHLICISATGSGKTRIVEEWVKQTKRKTLFISPLIALNQQQNERFSQSHLSPWIDVKTPESVCTISEVELKKNYDQVVIDECHTVFEWGDTFRPSIAKLPLLFSRHKTLWLTATLTSDQVKRLLEKLEGAKKVIGRFSFSEKLRIETLRIDWSKRLDFIRILQKNSTGVGILFCQSRDWCERLDRFLKAEGVKSEFYHSGLSPEERSSVEKRLKSGVIDVLICTIAFGLGMHIPEIKWGVMWGFPGSFLSLSQMIGRVGRSESGGVFYFLWSPEDELVWSRKQNKSKASEKDFDRLVKGLKKNIPLKSLIESELV